MDKGRVYREVEEERNGREKEQKNGGEKKRKTELQYMVEWKKKMSWRQGGIEERRCREMME